ncbi:MAG: phytanoyl-CoA dioxygenase family protein [Gammaproteobacteria bacterium]|nr:phytanoyl-CoA dioxygenase family protein [Gammaproteobacteria bacterium]
MRDITEEELRRYERDGVVHLPGLLDDDWLLRLEAAVAQAISADPAQVNFVDFKALAPMIEASGAEFVTSGVGSATGRFCISSFNWRQFPALGALCCGPPLPGAVAGLMRSNRINFYGEQLFLKEAHSLHRTAFHQDIPYFHVTGDKCCTAWVPLDAIDEDNGMMGYVRGSHRWPTHAANGFVTRMPLPGSSLPQLPDIEGGASEYDIVYIPAQPGDVIVHHANTVHGATGNSTGRDRRAASLHYLGDDVRYREREGTALEAGKSPTLATGDLMDSPEFPLVWVAGEGSVPPDDLASRPLHSSEVHR